jgi:hypothetical protein
MFSEGTTSTQRSGDVGRRAPSSLVLTGIMARGLIWGDTSPSSIDLGEFERLDADGTLERPWWIDDWMMVGCS